MAGPRDRSHQAGSPSAPVFISYAREDQEFVRRLHAGLATGQRGPWVDWEGIRPSEEWLARIRSAIEAARAVICVISPASVASTVCAMEVEHAVGLHKRLIPVACRDTDENATPEALRRRNWIFMRDSDDFAQSLAKVVEALDTDFEWVDAHAALLVKAREWERKGHDRSLLLRGSELKAAEAWLSAAAAHPDTPPTAQHTAYILDGRKAATRRQRIGAVTLGVVLLIVGGLAGSTYRANERWALERKIADSERQKKETAQNLAEEKSRVAEEKTKVAALEAQLKTEQESLRMVAEAYQVIYRDPLQAAVSAQRALQHHTSAPAAAALEAAHRVALLHRANGQDAATFLDVGSFSFEKRLRPGEVYSALSRDGRHVLLSTKRAGRPYGPELRGEAYVLDHETRQDTQLHPCSAHSGQARLEDARFSASGREIFVARSFHVDVYGLDGQCALRDSLHFQGTKSPLHLVAGYLNTRFLIAVDSMGHAWVMDSTGKHGARPLEGLGRAEGDRKAAPADAIIDVDLSPDAKSALAMYESGRVDLLGAQDDGRFLHWRVLPQGGLAAAFRPGAGGPAFATAEKSGKVRAWAVEGSRLAAGRSFDHGGRAVDTVGFSADGTWIASIDADCVLRFWNLTGRREGLVTLPKGMTCARQRAPADRQPQAARDVAQAGPAVVPAPAEVREAQVLARLPAGLAIRGRREGHRGEIFDLAFSQDGRLLASASADGTVRIWDVNDAKKARALALAPFEYVLSVAAGSAGGLVAAGTESATIRLWRLEDGAAVKSSIAQNWGPVNDIAFSPDGRLLAIAGGSDTVHIWDLAADALKRSVRVGHGRVRVCAFTSAGQLVVGTTDGMVGVVDVNKGSVVATASPGHRKGVERISTDRRGSLVTTTDGSEVVMWTAWPLARSGAAIRPPGAPVTSIDLSGDGQLLAAGLGNGTVGVWNAATGQQLLGPLPGHGTTYVGGVAFSPDGQTLASGGGDAKVVLWSLK